jgi:choline dehydrogenase
MTQPGHKAVDYIVIGAGSAGCVIANRLTADPQRSVLLLEAGGPDDHLFLRMPLAFLKAMFQPRFVWNYMSEPEPHLNGRQLWLPRGRLLGGSSSINGMFYMRGHSSDFDAWREMGCEGWGYEDVLPYFRRMETSWRGANRYHGDSGPLHVVPIETSRLLHDPLMQSAAAAGYQVTDDLHGELEEGFARGEVTIDPRGRRASTARAYLHPVASRANLNITMHAETNRILLENGRAVGVEYVHNGQVLRVRAAREVIVCGGAYNSAQPVDAFRHRSGG